MNIVILADSFPPYICGVTTHTVELARQLIKKGHNLLIFAPQYKEKVKLPRELSRARIVYLPSLPTTYQNLRLCAPSFYRLVPELSRFHPTLFYAQNPSILSIEAQQYAKLFSIPYVGSFHTMYGTDAYLEMVFRTKHARKLVPSIWTILRWFYNTSDHVIVPTPSIRDYIVKNGIDKKPISVLPSLLDIKNPVLLTTSDKVALKKQYKLNTHVAGFVGRLSLDKGIDRLLSIWSHVVKEIPDSTLLLVGEAGLYQKEIDAIIAQYRLSKNVVCTGAIPHDSLMSSGLLSVFDIFVSTSKTDTFGLSMLECMAHGVPVVIPRTQGLKDVVGSGGIVSKNDTEMVKAIITMLINDKFRLQRGHQAQMLARKYRGEIGVNLYLKEFKKIIAQYEKNKKANRRDFYM
ncbi:glycosyltransferase [Candidatus Roizmanbacteria bacterium]|nr:glycosyltransferase [Candidatus Roizmanbacteria bacterium]